MPHISDTPVNESWGWIRCSLQGVHAAVYAHASANCARQSTYRRCCVCCRANPRENVEHGSHDTGVSTERRPDGDPGVYNGTDYGCERNAPRNKCVAASNDANYLSNVSFHTIQERESGQSCGRQIVGTSTVIKH